MSKRGQFSMGRFSLNISRTVRQIQTKQSQQIHIQEPHIKLKFEWPWLCLKVTGGKRLFVLQKFSFEAKNAYRHCRFSEFVNKGVNQCYLTDSRVICVEQFHFKVLLMRTPLIMIDNTAVGHRHRPEWVRREARTRNGYTANLCRV